MATRSYFRIGLIREVVVMAFETVRSNKMRSGLTVLGVVIGITSIVGMTALIRGFDQSLRDMIRAIGPNTIFIQRFGVTSFANGAEITQLLKRPNLSLSDARALEEQSETLEFVDLELGAGPGPTTQQRVFFRDQKTKPLVVFGTSENFAAGTRIPIVAGRYFNDTELQYRKNVCVLGNTAFKLLFEPAGIDPIGKTCGLGASVRSRRGLRQAAGGRRIQPRPGRLRRRPLHRVSARVRASGGPGQPLWHGHEHPDFRPATRRREQRAGHRRRRAHHAHPARAEARRTERL